MAPINIDSGALPEFVFGPLSTDDGRARRARTDQSGFVHNPSREPIDPRHDEPVTIRVRVGADVAIASAALHYTTNGALPEMDSGSSSSSSLTVDLARTSVEWDTMQWGYVEEWSAVIPGLTDGTVVRYLISAQTNTGERIYSPFLDARRTGAHEHLDPFILKHYERRTRGRRPQVYEFQVDTLSIPDWLREAVIYQIFVDRFAPAPGKTFEVTRDLADVHGGTLSGILSKLDYLSDLGVTCLWLTPIFTSPSYHGYDPVDYYAIEPRLGTENDFCRLLSEAHGRGIRIVLDFVANHVSSLHPAFSMAQRDPLSPTRDWFYFGQTPGQYDCFYDVPNQPIVDTDHPGVRDCLIGAASHWLRQGCDGFRLDHAHGVTHAFWSAFRAAARRAKPDAIMLGEITDTPTVARSFAGRMDGCLDFGLLELLRGFFVLPRLTASRFELALQRHFAYYGESLALPSFLDNHDMNRFLWMAGGDLRRLRLAALCQFTLPGPPIIYYGTEVGLSQRQAVGRLEEARLPMVWGEKQDPSLRAFYTQLIALRRQTSRTWSLPRRTLAIDDARSVYAYACGDYAVALNNGASPAAISIQPAAELVLASDASASIGRDCLLRLPSRSGAICRFI